MSDEYPPNVDYPEGHSPMCPRDCTHECHRPYDEWKVRQVFIHPPMAIATRPQDWEPTARAILFDRS